MSDPSHHPTREELSAYSLGDLPDERAVAIDNHISECQPCCETIVGISSDDTFVGLLKEARELPTDQTVDHEVTTTYSSCQDVPVQLAEHPRYEILGLIGKGGMGDVYKARHRKMERTVALKVINRGLIRKTQFVDRFHREVKAAAQLSHPNIVTAYDADQADDFHFMVMECVDGVDLSRTVNDRGGLPVAEACNYIQQAAIGLQHAHERGMVHRDIKPHNLMVTKDGTVKILDFGLASLAPDSVVDHDTVEARGDLTAAGTVMGTPDFISPEQAEDARKADIRSDIYSLGATLYFLLTGRPPFAEGSLTQKIKGHARFEPEPIESYREDVPADLVTIVTKMTAKNPNDRYQTPAEVAEAFERFCRPIEPRTIVEPENRAQWRRWSNKSVKLVAVFCVAAILAGFGYFLQSGNGVPSEDRSTIGTHPLTIIDSSGRKPLGGTSKTHRNDVTGTTTHSFESANGRYKITLVDKILTVNGDKYTLENPNDSIRIIDDRVEITRVSELPKDGDTELKKLQGDWQVTAFTQNGKKEFATDKGVSMKLHIQGETISRSQTGRNGKKSEKEWGRIKLESTTNPKSIDIIKPDSPDDRLLGIYKLKDGELIICVSEQSNVDVAQRRQGKRPTIFAAPAGSKLVLLECQRVAKQPEDRSSNQATSEREEYRLDTEKPLGEVKAAIRKYYVNKYPLFAASVNQTNKAFSDFKKLRDRETLRQIGELAIVSPVSEVINSFPGKPSVTFTEKTFLSKTEVMETRVNLYQTVEESCRIVVTSKRRGVTTAKVSAKSKPITKTEIRKLLAAIKLTDAEANRIGTKPVEKSTPSQPTDDKGTKDPSTELRLETEGKTDYKDVLIYHTQAQLSEDKKTTLVKSGAILQMWNLESGKLTSLSQTGGEGGVLGFVPNKNLAWHAGSRVEFWDLKKRAKTGFVIPHSTGPSEGLRIPPAISDDGKVLAARDDTGKFQLWNLETQKPLSQEIDAGKNITRLIFSPNGKWLFVEDISDWSIWNVAQQKRVAGPFLHQSTRYAPISVSPDSARIATIENNSQVKPSKHEVVVRVAKDGKWKETQRISLPNSVCQTTWIDNKHLAAIVEWRKGTYEVYVVSIDNSVATSYGFLRTFGKISIAPDHRHFVISNYAAATCWKLGQKEHLWKIGTTEAGRNHVVHFVDGYVVLHEKGQTTGARPAIVRSIENGNEVLRKNNVISTATSGSNIVFVDDKEIQVFDAKRLRKKKSAKNE